MKTTLLSFLTILMSSTCWAQKNSKKVIDDFIYKGNVYTFEFSQEDTDSYAFTITKLNFKADAAKQPAAKDTAAKDSKSTVPNTPPVKNDALEKAGPDAGKIDVASKAPAAKDTESPATNTPPVKSDGSEKTEPATANSSEKVSPSPRDSSEDQSNQVYFSEFSKAVFDEVFKQQMIKIFGETADSALQEKASEVFFKIKSRLDFLDDEPTTAHLILKRDEKVYSFLKENDAHYYDGRLSKSHVPHDVHRVSVETDDGTIKNIKVHLVEPGFSRQNTRSPRKYLEFKNQYPISISGKFDGDRLANINLYCINCGGTRGLSRFIKLSDLVALDIEFENDKENYSPGNMVVDLAPNNPVVELKKEKRSKILDISAFTDFVGLNQEQPNGLVQFEIKRKVMINTNHKIWGQRYRTHGDTLIKRYTMEDYVQKYDLSEVQLDMGSRVQKGRDFIYRASMDSTEERQDTVFNVRIVKNKFIPVNYVWFNNIEFKMQFLKLEENNRYLPKASQTIAGHIIRIQPIDLYRYQLTSLGGTMDIYKINFTQQKFTWNVLNVGLNWFTVRAEDSTTVSGSEAVGTTFMNVVSVNPSTSFTFRPDSRWGVTVGGATIKQHVWHNGYELENKKALLQVFLNAHLKTSENARLFFRFRLTREAQHKYQNFTQMQLGYNVDLFSAKK